MTSLTPPTEVAQSSLISPEQSVDSLDLFLNTSSLERRKQLGQFFTPDTVAALACASSIFSADASVIDPMCGAGAMLFRAADRFRLLARRAKTEGTIDGIELDPFAAKLASTTTAQYANDDIAKIEITCADAFLELSGMSLHSIGSSQKKYDAVVGNPPYVRYQAIAKMLQHADPKLIKHARKALGSVSDSILTSSIIRASLIASLVENTNNRPESRLLGAIDLLRGKPSHTTFDAATQCWLNLVANYSGLADLSLPSWLLTWNLANEGAHIAYVTTSSWRNREYSRLLRYFMLRMLQPVCIIEQEGNSWFPDALVPTSLIILRARPKAHVQIPLSKRAPSDHVVRFVRVHRKCNLADPVDFAEFARQFDASVAPGDITKNAHTIATGIAQCLDDAQTDLFTINLAYEHDLIEKLLTEDEFARQSKPVGVSLAQLDGATTKATTVSPRSTLLPPEIVSCINITPDYGKQFQLLSDYDVTVNQGLRTGCNPAFYLEAPSPDVISKWLPDWDLEKLQEMYAEPAGHRNDIKRISKLINQQGGFASEKPTEPSLLVLTSEELGSKPAVMPISILRFAVRYQRDMYGSWKVGSTTLKNYALVTAGRATQSDIADLSNYPKEWLKHWKLSALPESVSQYLDTAAQTYLIRNGHQIRIPDLSAVCTNHRMPMQPSLNDMSAIGKIPAAPSWWHTMPILPRHDAGVFMARVNNDKPIALLNDTKQPAIIDANFSTFSDSKNLSQQALFALLNSLWVNANLEALATPMGGGALKVEAAHLRSLPIPILDRNVRDALHSLGGKLAQCSNTDEPLLLCEIDRTIMECISTQISSERVIEQLREFCRDKRQRRRR